MKRTSIIAIAVIVAIIVGVPFFYRGNDKALIGDFGAPLVTVNAQGPQFELACANGTQPMPFLTTYNPTTNKYRAGMCVDPNGTVTSPVFTGLNTFGQLLATPNGTAAHPNFSFANATNSGLYFDATAGICCKISASGTDVVAFWNTGAMVLPSNAGTQGYGISPNAGVNASPDVSFGRAGANLASITATAGLQTPLITQYGGTATAGNGVPSNVAVVNSGTQTGSIVNTTLVTAPANTWYRVTIYMVQIAAGTGCSTNTTVQASMAWTDPLAAGQTSTSIFALFTITTNGAANTPMIGLSASTTGVSFLVNAKSGTTVQYGTTFAGGTCTTTPTYQENIIVERL